MKVTDQARFSRNRLVSPLLREEKRTYSSITSPFFLPVLCEALRFHERLKRCAIELLVLHQHSGQALQLVEMLLQETPGRCLSFIQDGLYPTIHQPGQAGAAC